MGSIGIWLWSILLLTACNSTTYSTPEIIKIMNTVSIEDNNIQHQQDTAVFGAGCFWCVEAQFQLLNGVIDVKSGYTGGITENPTYEQVCTGNTEHAEVVRIVYNPTTISYDALLQAFFMAHDPTQLNRQGNDIGTQYRSAIYYNSTAQQEKAKYYIDQLNAANVFPNPIVTEVTKLGTFYPAEAYHDNYYNQNKQQSYCNMVVTPKVEHFKEVFKAQLK